MNKSVPWEFAQTLARVPSAWAVLLCRFKDGPPDLPIPRATFERLFTTEGEGTWNTVRFFHDMSHGLLDLSGSRLFGLFDLDVTLEEYGPELPNDKRPIPQEDVVRMAREAARNAGVPLDSFFGDCVTFNVAVGGAQGNASLDGRPYAWADYRWVANNGTQAWGHEMGHGYGLGHSREEGSDVDYRDPWDVMSAGLFSAPDPDFGRRGPGLNAANMREVGWLREDRVWRGPSHGFDQVIELRPLHRRDLPGMLAAELPSYGSSQKMPYLLEYREREGWDDGIPRAAVLIHQLIGGRSYLVPSSGGVRDLVKGHVLERGALGIPWSSYSRAEVIEIDAAQHRAAIRLQYRPAAEMGRYEIPAKVLGQVAADGGGLVVSGGGVTPVDPWSPMLTVLRDVTAWAAADALPDTRLRQRARYEVLQQMLRHVQTALESAEITCSPAPPEILADDESQSR